MSICKVVWPALASAQPQWYMEIQAASASDASEGHILGCCRVHEPGLKLLDSANEYHCNALLNLFMLTCRLALAAGTDANMSA